MISNIEPVFYGLSDLKRHAPFAVKFNTGTEWHEMRVDNHFDGSLGWINSYDNINPININEKIYIRDCLNSHKYSAFWIFDRTTGLYEKHSMDMTVPAY